MKIVPILTAVIVAVVLYLFVFERERLLTFAGGGTTSADTTLNDSSAASPPVVDTSAVRVVAMVSHAQMIENAVVLRGRTQAAREVIVATETTGLVVNDPLRKGGFVEAGDILCELDPGTRQAQLSEANARLSEAEGRVPEAEAGLAEANARVAEAAINSKAAQQLSAGGFASETRVVSAEAVVQGAAAGVQRANSAVVSAKAGIEAAAAGVALAMREIERLTIRAPFEGLLETDTAELGSLLRPGDACAKIVQLDPIKLIGFVPEAEVSKVVVGAPVQARLTGGQTLQGEVSYLSRSSDPTTRTFQVEARVPNTDLAIRDGQTAEILIGSQGRSAHLVPQSALTLDDNGALGVRLVGDDSAAIFAPITIIRDTVDGVYVTGLPDPANIITIGQEFVIDGVTVLPTYRDTNAPDDGSTDVSTVGEVSQ